MRRYSYFIADMHLGAGYIADPKAHERRIANWLRSIAPTAKELYILGDALDYWYEYRYVVPQGYIRFFGALAELADSGVKIIWLKGNHDTWIFDYLPRELGITVVDGVLDTTIDGHRFVMEHGDGCGETRKSYRLIHRVFRNRLAQRLFSAIHPRWTVGFAHRWSTHSRKSGCTPAPGTFDIENDHLIRWANGYASEHPGVEYFIFGHRHIVISPTLECGAKLYIIGDGFREMTYGIWNGETFSIRKMEENSTV